MRLPLPFPRVAWYRKFVRPWLFRLPPELALRAADRALAVKPFWPLYATVHRTPRWRNIPMDGVQPRNPVGLAAGLDKQCAYLDSLGHLGFGYVIGGTVTLNPRPGNPKPRVLRLPERESIINALGFPSVGLDEAARRLEALRRRPAKVLVSIAALEDDDTEVCLRRLEPLVSGVELNISSPNTLGVRKYQQPDALRMLLERLNGVRHRPLFIKLPPYMDEVSKENTFALVRVCKEAGVSGITAINTVPVEERKLAMRRGGLSGRSIFRDMLRIIPEIRREAGPGMVINACGGISTADDAAAALDAGADTVQLYSALVYRGPGAVHEIVRGLAERGR
ncbi:MAG: dihydroorotate dehydrogenase 2 [Dehalococcoidia bacterium]